LANAEAAADAAVKLKSKDLNEGQKQFRERQKKREAYVQADGVMITGLKRDDEAQMKLVKDARDQLAGRMDWGALLVQLFVLYKLSQKADKEMIGAMEKFAAQWNERNQALPEADRAAFRLRAEQDSKTGNLWFKAVDRAGNPVILSAPDQERMKTLVEDFSRQLQADKVMGPSSVKGQETDGYSVTLHAGSSAGVGIGRGRAPAAGLGGGPAVQPGLVPAAGPAPV
jgi:hypothetical protein